MSQPQAELDTEAVTTITPTALEAQERAQIDVAISTAHAYPRSVAKAKKTMIEMATLDRETAEACIYTLKRHDNRNDSDKLIQGPSVRLAEIAAGAWGNMAVASRIVANDGKTVTAQAICHDLERNVRIGMEVKRSILSRNGRSYSTDMQTVAENAACAIALRNSIFRVVPKVYINAAYERCLATVKGDAKTVGERWAGACKRFAAWGKTEADVLALLGKKCAADVTVDDIPVLVGFYNSIREGEQTVESVFAPPPAPVAAPAAAPLVQPPAPADGLLGLAPAPAPLSAAAADEPTAEQLDALERAADAARKGGAK